MWSLFKKDGNIEKEITPLIFSNGKTQKDIVKEVIDKFKEGKKIIFIKGVCGSGKSAIALNIARNFKKASIVVPIKTLQQQYEEDYTNKKFLKKENGEKLNISIIKGRNNFHCTFCNCSAEEKDLPCTLEIKEKNKEKIIKLLQKNPFFDMKNFKSVKEIKRISLASSCPYWSPLLRYKSNSKVFENAAKKDYLSVSEEKFYFYQREKGCPYYEQYASYIDSDVLVFNSLKYLIEYIIGRKPKTDVDIIDECDAFLDEMANQKKISLTKLVSSLGNLLNENKEEKQKIKELIKETNFLINEAKEEIENLYESKFYVLFKKILANPNLSLEDEENYFNNVLENCKTFEGFEKETFVSYEVIEEEQNFFGSSKKEVCVKIASTNLSSRLKEITKNTSLLVLMSGTLHSKEVLKDIFGLDNFEIIEAETEIPGKIKKIRTGLEKNCKYENFSSGKIERKDYLKALEACMENAVPPVLVHVSSFYDLPNEEEKKKFNLKKLITREKLTELQKNFQERINDFKNKSLDILYTTKCSRGVDFPGDQCNSVVITKFPYPDVKDFFWQVLKKRYPEKYKKFYLDKAQRELIQKVFRAIRFKGDEVFLLSPDSRVLDFNFEKKQN